MKIKKGSRIVQLLNGTHQRQMDALLAQPNVFSPERVAEALRSATDDAWEQSDPEGFRHFHASRSEAARARKSTLSE
jgi:hypothetical protein